MSAPPPPAADGRLPVAAPDRERPDPPSPSDDRLIDVPGALFDARRSKVERYADLVVGERGWWPLVRHELVMLVASWVPGAHG
jgi:hypothetical protein